MKRLGWVIGLFLCPSMCWAVPDTTITISPTCTSGTTITCSDNTSRMNSISTGYNSHSHADLTKTTQNTFTIGNSASGSKALAIANQFTTSPSIRYRDTTSTWQFSNDASTFNDFANLGTVTTTIGAGTAANQALAISLSFTTSPSIRYNRTAERFQFSNNASTFIDMTRLESTDVSFTRTAAQGAGAVSITGVGFTPTSVWIMCVDNVAGSRMSISVSDSARNAMEISNIAGSFSRNTAQLIDVENGADNMSAPSISSYDADGFSFTWSKGGAGLQANCVAIAYR